MLCDVVQPDEGVTRVTVDDAERSKITFTYAVLCSLLISVFSLVEL